MLGKLRQGEPQVESQPGLHSVSLSKIKIRSIISYLIYLVPEEKAEAQPS